jgi:TonB family protein
MRSTGRQQISIAALVGLAHLVAIWALQSSTRFSQRPRQSLVVMEIHLLPRIRTLDDPVIVTAPELIHVALEKPMIDLIPIVDVPRPLTQSMGVGTVPPTAESAGVSKAAYVAAAGLVPGDGATVVLRIEVLDSGEVGRVEVDVSSRDPRIDEAAMAYVRAWHWRSGTRNGEPQSMWIRLGVRLDG